MKGLATIEKITEVYPHTGADALEFVRVKNFRCIVRKGQFRVGDWCVLIQPDTVLPDVPWTEVYKKHSPHRVKALRLRGQWSFGIVESTNVLEDVAEFAEYPETWAADFEGMDVSQILGITKYEEKEPEDPDAESGYPYWLRKTGEDLYQSIPVEEYYGRLVDVTLKLDGKSCTRFYKGDVIRDCSRRLVFKPDADNLYSKAMLSLQKQFQYVMDCVPNKNFAFRGEIVGQGASSGKHNPNTGKPTKFHLFGVYDCDTLENYGPVSPYYFDTVGKLFGIPTVPILEKQVPLTPELIEKYQNMETLPDGTSFEGVVVVGDGFSFKIINLNYDSKK